MTISITSARGGSKRIPRKHIEEFCGKPMIGWSIKTAKACGGFERITASTDDNEITEIARRWGGQDAQPWHLCQGFKAGDYPEAGHHYYAEVINSSLYFALTDTQQELVVNALKKAIVV